MIIDDLAKGNRAPIDRGTDPEALARLFVAFAQKVPGHWDPQEIMSNFPLPPLLPPLLPPQPPNGETAPSEPGEPVEPGEPQQRQRQQRRSRSRREGKLVQALRFLAENDHATFAFVVAAMCYTYGEKLVSGYRHSVDAVGVGAQGLGAVAGATTALISNAPRVLELAVYTHYLDPFAQFVSAANSLLRYLF
jgi:hypothetical protein